MLEFNKNVKIVSYTIDDVNEKDLGLKIYEKLVEDLDNSIKVDDYKMETLDMFAKESYFNDVRPEWVNYKSIDTSASYERNGQNVSVDITCNPNNLTISPNAFDLILTIGNKFGYGNNHNSLFEVERVIKPGGLLIVALSKFWFYREFNQMLLGYRNWDYVKALEINYKIIETKVDSAKYFCFYKNKG